jgi:hypothetical protein
MRLSSTSRNYTDDFFALFLIESMDDQQNRTGAYGSNGYPPLLIFRSEVALGKSIGIIENEHGRFKANIVLAKALPVFLFIPFKSHNPVATTTAYGLFLHVSIHLYVHRPQYEPGGLSPFHRPCSPRSVPRSGRAAQEVRQERRLRLLGGNRLSAWPPILQIIARLLVRSWDDGWDDRNGTGCASITRK